MHFRGNYCGTKGIRHLLHPDEVTDLLTGRHRKIGTGKGCLPQCRPKSPRSFTRTEYVEGTQNKHFHISVSGQA